MERDCVAIFPPRKRKTMQMWWLELPGGGGELGSLTDCKSILSISEYVIDNDYALQ